MPGLLLWGFKIFRVIEENAYLKNTALYNKKELTKLGFSDNSMLVCMFV